MMQHNIRQKEKGVALLLALGVMSLLLAMALAFVTNAVIARSSAANNSARSQARYFGKTAANRMLVDFMQTQKENPTLTDFSSLVSKGSGKTDALEGNSSLLTVTIGSDQYTPDSNKQPEWVYLYEKVNIDGTPANNTPIIGRYAYMVLPKPGVISLSEALRGQTDLTYPTSWEKRPGVDMKEFDLSKVITDTGLLKSAAERFGTPLEDHTSSPQVLNEDYSDYDGFFGEFSVPAATQNLIRNYFSMGGRTEAESYPYDPQCGDDAEEISDSATYYHRFNLARKDWDSGLSTTANSEDAVNRLLGLANENAPVFKTDDSVTPTGMRLQFLRMIGDDKGAYASLEDRRRQIAANLIDYSDSDNIPTSDVEPTSWKTTMTYPAYTGNERTPYLNEVAVQVSATAARSDTVLEGKTIVNIDGIVRVESIAAEIFDIYEDIPVDSGSYSVTISGSFDVDVKVGDTSYSHTFSIPDVSIPIETITNRYGYGVNNSSGIPTFDFLTPNINIQNPESAINVTVKVSDFKINKMVLTQGTNTNMDFTRDLTVPSGTEKVIMNQGLAKDETKVYSAAWGFSVDDPRENLYQGEGAYENWQLYTTSEVAGTPLLTAFDTQTLGNQNVNCLPANAGDKEGGAPETLSTAYIRNAPMTSPLELGAIHRGAKWETINLKAAVKFSRPDKYDPEADIKNKGSSYDEGDAGILDQIKMTSATYDAAKVNLNNRVNTPEGKNIFYALTSNVATIGTTAADPLAGTKSTTDAFASDIVALPTTTFIPNRAGILREITYSDTGATTDMGKEALLAKTACLMTTKSPPSEDIRVILVAQAVTDIGGVKVSKIMEGETTPRTENTTLGTLDYYKDEGNGKLVYFDDIRGEVKMLLTVKRDPVTQQLKVTQMEFVD